MSKRINTKHKIDRRLGINLWGNPKSPINKRKYGPGEHGQRRKKSTEFGIQLFAKQKLKGYYGNIGEKAFRKYYKESVRRKGDTSQNLIGLLESRLDSVVYRSKFVSTVFAARQFINHGHILVNNKRVNISSYILKDGDTVEIKEKSKSLAFVIESISSGIREIPEYISVDEKKFVSVYIRVPTLEEVPYPVKMEPNLVVEFYSR